MNAAEGITRLMRLEMKLPSGLVLIKRNPDCGL
jgi:hypothetical protein